MGDSAIYEILGRAVSARRDELKLTQQALADKIGLSRASVANIESGRQKVLLHQVYKLVRALGLKSITELLPAAPLVAAASKSELGIALSRSDLSEDERASVNQFLQVVLPKSQSK
jgi:transcriptional regulator with XRE-family HTH domain